MSHSSKRNARVILHYVMFVSFVALRFDKRVYVPRARAWTCCPLGISPSQLHGAAPIGGPNTHRSFCNTARVRVSAFRSCVFEESFWFMFTRLAWFVVSAVPLVVLLLVGCEECWIDPFSETSRSPSPFFRGQFPQRHCVVFRSGILDGL